MSKEKVLIANRGEIAIRIMQACNHLGIDFVCVYTRNDEKSLHVSLARQKGEKNVLRISSYTDPNEIFSVADYTGCTAIHPGYGFFSENFRFARRAELRTAPLIFIGPRWEVIRDLGSKINTKHIAKSLNIPVIPGSDSPIYSEEEAEQIAIELFCLQKQAGIEIPSILIKASAGGGGMGIEEVNNLDTFRRAYRRIQNYARRQFGDEGVLIEQCVSDYHHLEVQILCSQHHEIVHFGTRNCTIQSAGRQKRVEIAPGFDPDIFEYTFDAREVLNKIVNYSIKLAKHVNYDSVGTWEWIITRDGNPYLMEVNTRIQVENEISARISRIKGHNPYPNLIKEQIRVAFGDRLGYTQDDITFEGTSIELRIVAEDTQRNFRPWVGKITRFEMPDFPFSRVYTHVPGDKSYKIPAEFDPNLALAIIWGKDTEEAKSHSKKFLENVNIEGEDGIFVNNPYLFKKIDEVLRF